MQGDQLVFEARKEIMQGKKLGVDSMERRIHAETAARNLVKVHEPEHLSLRLSTSISSLSLSSDHDVQ